MVGEKYLNPDNYENGLDGGDNNSMMQGSDYDTVRWTYDLANSTGPNAVSHTPLRDTPGYGYTWADPPVRGFGSAHSGATQFVFCDGSVHSIRYEVDPIIFRYLGNRNDGQQVKGGDDF